MKKKNTHISTPLIMLAVRLHPVQPQSVQERRQTLRTRKFRREKARKEKATHLHETKDTDSKPEPHRTPEDEQGPVKDRLRPEDGLEGHGPKHLRQLRVRERERPEPEVRRRVRNAPEAKLDGVDDLVDHHVAEIVLLLRGVSVST